MTRSPNADNTLPNPFLTRIGRVWTGPTLLPRTLRGIVGTVTFTLLTGLIAAAGAFVLTRLPDGLHAPSKVTQTLDFGMVYLFEGCTAVGALLATVLMSRLARRSWLDYGLRETHAIRRLLHGAVCGLVFILILMTSIVALHGVRFASTHVSSAVLLRNAVLWAGAFAFVALAEELLFRGYAFFTLARNVHPVFAALLLSFVFGAAHLYNGGETLRGALFPAAFGLIASLAVWRTGSLWWMFGLHLAIDWSETCLFGVADSGLKATHTLLKTTLTGPAWLTGGHVGIEGSLLNIPLMCVLAWFVWRRLPASTLGQARESQQLAAGLGQGPIPR